jgi:uncharacterized protein
MTEPTPPAPVAHLPGGIRFDDTLLNRFDEKARARGPGYRPRTKHLAPDGQALYTNRLFLESSPYLLQHAHNPVNWYPWGDEAFETARRLDCPVLVSIGYSTCHWCHVMEEESFEDEEIAAFLNGEFIAVKVDREERPDVDAVYMSAIQVLTGQGGWPLNILLLPDRTPFWGGTYFPARDGDRGAAMGFLTILRRIRQIYRTDRAKIQDTSRQLTLAVRSLLDPGTGSRVPGTELLEQAARYYQERFDPVNGGLKGAPKFPSSLPLRFLLRWYKRSNDSVYRQMAEQTLQKMAAGGMYDQAGGGFHRYSVDAGWLVPHFEKMLYDNALLAVAYLEAWQVTGENAYRKVVDEILNYGQRDMTAPDGGFYSATDADSLTPDGHREEGYFFTWTPTELEAVLGSERAAVAGRVYAVSPGGNFEGRSILNIPGNLDEAAAALGMSRSQLDAAITAINQELYQARKQRPAPIRDEKILTAWNGLMISAFAKAGRVLAHPDYTRTAVTAAAFIFKHLYRDGRLYRSFNDDQARFDAYLEDHAFLVAGLLDLFEATQDIAWLDRAIELDRVLEERFEDLQNGGFFQTGSDQAVLIAREKPNTDGATPSGNSVAMMNLLRLGSLTTEARYTERFVRALRCFLGATDRHPAALPEMLLAADYYLSRPQEIVIVTPADQPEAAEPFLEILRSRFTPHSVLAVVADETPGTATPRRPAIAAGKTARDGRATAYVCEAGACRQPTTDPQRFAELLG